MDEQSGMNFSEYMAILSGNTDLLDKAKLEKRIASLEGERKSFNKGRRESEFKLESKQSEYDNNAEKIRGMTEDWEKFTAAAKTDKDGNRVNALKINDFDSTDEKALGKRLQEIAKNATTGGRYKEVGKLYGFKVLVISEETLDNGLPFVDNRFMVEGNYKYTYNNGHLAMADPHAAATNFLNALEKIPNIIEQYKSKNETLSKEIEQLTAITEDMEERKRTEATEVRPLGVGAKDTARACSERRAATSTIETAEGRGHIATKELLAKRIVITWKG